MIEVQNLTRYYGDFPAVQDITFRVREGEILGVLGLNGAGKSTIFKVLAGLLPPSSGSVAIDGIQVMSAPFELRARIGFLPEDPPLYRDMTVRGFLTHMGRLRGLSKHQVHQRVTDVMALTDLTDRAHQVIATLSHGFRKRVGIAQSVLHNPRLVLLDEPISGLDPVQIVEMRKVIRKLGQGRAVLVSSHILSEISQTCDRILVMHQGRLVALGTEQELAGRLGTSSIRLTVRGDASALDTWLSEHHAVASHKMLDEEPPFAAAHIILEGDVREPFLPEVIEAGFGLRLVQTPEDDLEGIFLQLTRDEVTE
ncbi:MAG: ABC transporter ATP-binding protein [Deltaproteobacteria bacterium]|nr:ABC transporter ATP-binding protein [Deltaproteobacteria bacterium]